MKHRFALKCFLICGLLWLPVATWSQTLVPTGYDYVPTAGEPSPFEPCMLEKEPIPLNLNEVKSMIVYPPMAKEAEIEGKVVMRVLVSEQGEYVKHFVVKDPHPILTRAVDPHVSALRFTPAIQSGLPIKVWVYIPFDFRLMKAGKSFQSLEEALAYPDPSQVGKIYLSKKDLKEFPMEILRFENLTELGMDNNQLQQIPAEIQSLAKLRVLSLSQNQLSTLPPEVMAMPSLERIYLDGNLLPESYQQMLLKTCAYKIFPKDDKGKVQW